ncbi:MAG: M20/M25/M40 family metallo-hydrolase [Candidatus Bathyarchaeota archaeon]|jgi:acetylornithine deacetylase/succinyl-diaminopimelate desuccinylase-like protein
MNIASALIEERWEAYLEEVREFLRMPSISPTGEGIKETARFLEGFLHERLDVQADLLDYGGHPVVYGQMDNGSDRTLILYSMYDVLPAEPLNEWISPPFAAEIVRDRIIARGAVNTKAPLMSMLLGVEALKDSEGLPVNLVFILEGEEEIGSPSIARLVEDKKEELTQAQSGFFMMPTEGKRGMPQIILGKKGVIYLELTIKASRYDAHSSYAMMHHNPVEIASNLISTLKDAEGNIVADWLFEDVVTPLEYDLEYLPDLKEAFGLDELVEQYGIKKTRGPIEDLYVDVFFKPSVNVDGIIGGYTGEGAKTVTPREVTLKMDIRLVPNMTKEATMRSFHKHLEDHGFSEWIDYRLYHNYDWSRTSPNEPIVTATKQAFKDLGMKPYIITTAAGSAPEYLFTKTLGMPIITAGPGYGGRIHAPNEFIEIEGVRKMIEFTPLLLKHWDRKSI